VTIGKAFCRDRKLGCFLKSMTSKFGSSSIHNCINAGERRLYQDTITRAQNRFRRDDIGKQGTGLSSCKA
jgi:hypothetical protein